MPPRNSKNNGPTPITSLKHGEKRVNIPTEELRDFVEDDEKAPKTMLYQRDPSLDPQLVWKGKDEQGFEPPTSGRIAIKVINHYGDEVLRTYSV